MKYLLFTIFVIAAGFLRAAEKKPQAPLQQAIQVVKDSNRWLTGTTQKGYEEGCRILSEAIPQSTGVVKSNMMILKAQWLLAMKKHAEADALAVQCFQEFPKLHLRDKARLFGVRAGCLFDQQKWAEAMTFYIQIDPKLRQDYLVNMAKASMALGKYKDAEEYLALVVKRSRAQQRLYGAALEHLKKLNASAE